MINSVRMKWATAIVPAVATATAASIVVRQADRDQFQKLDDIRGYGVIGSLGIAAALLGLESLTARGGASTAALAAIGVGAGLALSFFTAPTFPSTVTIA